MSFKASVTSKPQFIILSDNISYYECGSQRYMGAYAIASAAEQAGFSSVVIDYFTRRKNFFAYLEGFLSEELLAIGIASTFLFPPPAEAGVPAQRSVPLQWYYQGELWYRDGLELAQWLEELKSRVLRKSGKAKIVMGGVKSQFALWRPQFYSQIDHIVFGAGDKVIVELLTAIQEERSPAEIEVRGFKVLDNISGTMKEKICPTMLFNKNWAIQPGEALPIEISRGCAFNCKFCHYEKKESVRKDAKLLRQELIRNYELFNTTVYHFCDDCFNDRRAKVEELCEMFLGLPFKIEWVAYSRVDVAVHFPQTADLMVAAGAKGLYWGLESFNADVARRAGKGTPPEAVKEFLISFNNKFKNRCLSEGSFIAGLPGETKESLGQTLDWILQYRALDLITVGPLGLMPYVESLDQTAFDYADYSRNPEKYGFKKVTFFPSYWEHSEMNSNEAQELAAQMTNAWRAKQRPGFLHSIWMYPHLRSLGFSSEEIFSKALDEKYFDFFCQETALRFQKFLGKYHEELAENYKSASDEQFKRISV